MIQTFVLQDSVGQMMGEFSFDINRSNVTADATRLALLAANRNHESIAIEIKGVSYMDIRVMKIEYAA